MARKCRQKPLKKMSEKKKQKLRWFVENCMSHKDKGRNKRPAMTNTYGTVAKPKGDGKIRDKHYNLMKPDKERRRTQK